MEEKVKAIIGTGRSIAAQSAFKLIFLVDALGGDETDDESLAGMCGILTDIQKQVDGIQDVFENLENLYEKEAEAV